MTFKILARTNIFLSEKINSQIDRCKEEGSCRERRKETDRLEARFNAMLELSREMRRPLSSSRSRNVISSPQATRVAFVSPFRIPSRGTRRLNCNENPLILLRPATAAVAVATLFSLLFSPLFFSLLSSLLFYTSHYHRREAGKQDLALYCALRHSLPFCFSRVDFSRVSISSSYRLISHLPYSPLRPNANCFLKTID